MYILVSCCEGNIIVSKYNTYDDAYARMEKEYLKLVAECDYFDIDIDSHNIEGYDAFVEYQIYYGCDWHIEEI